MTDFIHEVEAVLPALRRFAHALAGDRSRGDALVRMSIEAALRHPRWLALAEPRKQLFAALHEAWSLATSPGDPRVGVAPQAPLRQQLKSLLHVLTVSEREALLLHRLEGFDLADVSYIMHQPAERVGRWLTTAEAKIRTGLSAPVLIIEDEPLVATDLAQIVEEMGHTACGTAARVADAIDAARRLRPALIISDVRLKDGDSGIEAVREIRRSLRTPVIFVTAYPGQLTAAELPPTYVVSKPFDAAAVRTTIGEALWSSDGPPAE